MKYDYSKLQKPDVLNLINTYYNTKELTVLTSTPIDTILLGKFALCLLWRMVELIFYYTGLSKSTTHDLININNCHEKSKVSLHSNVLCLTDIIIKQLYIDLRVP